MTTRRRLLGVCALLGAVGVAGCLTTVGTRLNGGDSPGSDDGSTGTDDGTSGADAGDDSPGTDDDAGDGDDPPGDTDDDEQDGTRPRGTGGPGVSIAGRDPQPDLPLEVAVEVTREAATDAHPPGLRVSVTNTSDAAVGVGEGRAVVFAYRTSTGGALTLLPAEFEAPAEPGCWRLTDGIAVTEEYRVTRLGPGETVTRELSLYASHDEADACLPVGEFRFESAYAVFADPARPEEGDRATWGFSVLIE